MDDTKIIEIINKIEKRFPVDKWTINNIHIWPLIRIELRFKLRNLITVSRKNNFKVIRYASRLIRLFINFLKYAYIYLSDFRHNDSIKDRADIIFFTSPIHRSLLKDFYYDRFCDPFIDAFQDLKRKATTFEVERDNYEFRVPRYRPSVLIQHWIDYWEIKNKLFRKKPNPENEKLDGFLDFIQFLESENYGIAIPNIQDLRYRVDMVLEMAEYFKKIFNKIRPSIVFMADYYSLDRFAAILACRKDNIPSIDIQHGVTSEYDAPYGRWNKIPEGGYEILPSIFWCWSEEEANMISKWNTNVSGFHKAFVGGNLWLNLWKDQNNGMVKYYDHQITQIKSNMNKSVYLLYTVNMFYGGIPECVIEAMRLTTDSFFWWIRMHPYQLKEYKAIWKVLKKYNLANFEMDKATSFPLPALLRHADVHVTSSCSTIKEAEYLGIPSVFTHESGTAYYAREVASGMALYARTTEELLRAINIQLIKKNGLEKTQKESAGDNLTIIKDFLRSIKNEKGPSLYS